MKLEVKMKNKSAVILKTVLLAFIFYTCHVSLLAAAQKKPAHPPFLEPQTHKGKVVTTMDSGGYTYIQFEEKGKKLWAATGKMKVSVGDSIEFSQGAPMKNFHSRTLNKTFEDILFVGVVKVAGAKETPGKSMALAQSHAPIGSVPKGHVPIGKKIPQKITVKPGSIKKAPGGYTVTECYSMKDSLKGKTVTVRGKVVKFASQIMGKNWIHIQDGTGKEGTNDLTVTSAAIVNVGDVVLVSGKIAYDKNFGAGYVYPVIIEDASITVEK
jgi:hypothetical protein